MDCEQFRAIWVLVLDGTLDEICACTPLTCMHFEECAACDAWLTFMRAMKQQNPPQKKMEAA